jgi:hypothetical protein
VIKELEAAPDVRPYNWTAFELDMIRKYYLTKKPGDIARILGRTKGAVINKASVLGLNPKEKGGRI